MTKRGQFATSFYVFPIFGWRNIRRVFLHSVFILLSVLVASDAAQAQGSAAQHHSAVRESSQVIQVQKGMLVVGSEQDYPPFATGLTDETAGGFTVDLWKAVAAEEGLSYTIRVRPFRELLQDFKEGRVDVLINLAHSDERHQFADFTVPHVIVHGAIFVRKGETGIRSEDDLAGKSIIVLNADLAHDYALSKGWGKQLVLVDTAADGMRLLASGQHDAMLLSKLAGMQTLQALGLSKIEPLKVRAGFSQKFAFAVHEGQSELLGKINEGLALSKTNGTYNALYDKWFGIYEVKEVGLRDLLKYIIPIIGLFLAGAGYSFYRRQIERKRHAEEIEDLYNRAPCGYHSLDSAGCIVRINDTELDWLGYTRSEVVGKMKITDLLTPASVLAFQKNFPLVKKQGFMKDFEPEFVRKDGSTFNALVNATIIYDADGNYLMGRSTIVDITERKKAEETLRTLSTAIEQSPVSIVITDVDANIEYVNPRFSEVTGYTAQEAIGRNPRILQSGLTPKESHLELWETVTNGQVWHGELINKRKNGEIYWEEAHIAPVKNAAGVLSHYVAAKVDITQRKQSDMAVRQSEERFRFMLENSPIAVRIAQLKTGQVVFANQRYAELIGMTRDKVIGAIPRQYYANPRDYDEILVQLGHGRQVTNQLIELRIPSEDSNNKWVLASYLQLDYQNEPSVLGWFYDISDRKKMEEQVQHLAHHDPLTDLPNRTLFADRLQQSLAGARREKKRLALMFIDLDKFKPINDSLGHDVGDLLLKQVAQRIQDCLRESDTVGRIGGDEFVVLLPVIEEAQDALVVAEKIRTSLNLPFAVVGHSLSISSSTGIAIHPEHGEEENQLMKNADTAMYYAKAEGRNKVKLYQTQMQELNP